jgi:hypothetical protein
MSNTTITNLTPVVSLSGAAEIMIVQSGTSYSATAQQIANLNANGGTVTSITAVSPLSGGTITASGSIGLNGSSIDNSYLSAMPTLTIKGNNTGSSANPLDLTVAQTMTMLGAAPLASPAFTGIPTAPTPTTSDSSTQIATTAYVQAQGFALNTAVINTTNGISGGAAVSSNPTLYLTPINDSSVLSNITGSSASPTGNTLSSVLDYMAGSSYGSILYRGNTSWYALAPGNSGQVLQTKGANADPVWYSIPSTSGGGTVTSLTPGTNMLFSSNPITVTGTISTVNNPVFSTSVTTPLVVGGTTASSTLTLESTSGAGTSDSIIFKVGSQVTQGIINSSGQVVFGPSIQSTTNLGTNKNLTGGITWFGFQSSGTIQSDVTTNAVGIRSVPATAAVTTGGAYTLSNIRTFESSPGAQGANSQITNLQAYWAGVTYGATGINAGFYSTNFSSTTATISNVAIQSSVFVGAISGTTLTVSSVTSGNIAIGQVLTGTGVTAGTFIVSGSGLSWVVSASQTVSAGTTFTSDQSVTITTSAAHTITRGQPSTLIVATTNTAVNGSFTITSVPATTTFTYTLPAILATALVATNTYIITSIGSTDFTLIGAASNTVGLAFTATGAGTGSGTASLYGVSAADTGTTYQYANRYNFYASGTAPNSFAGGLSVGITSNSGGLALSATNAAFFRAGSTGVTYTDIISSGTVSNASASIFSPGTAFAARLATTYTTAATVYISAAPTAGTNVTFTNAYSLYVAAGATQLQALNYTTSVGTTSGTVPLVIGGTTASSTLTLQSTSGAGTTDSVLIKVGNNGAVTAATFNTAGVALSTNWYNTATQTATNTATLTAAQITGPFLLGTPTATASYTLPLASAVETALGTPPTGTGWEFTVFTTAAFAITLLTATGWTLVGSMATGAAANSFARFRAAKTGAGAYSLYRIS